jgi:hypothetical protein
VIISVHGSHRERVGDCPAARCQVPSQQRRRSCAASSQLLGRGIGTLSRFHSSPGRNLEPGEPVQGCLLLPDAQVVQYSTVLDSQYCTARPAVDRNPTRETTRTGLDGTGPYSRGIDFVESRHQQRPARRPGCSALAHSLILCRCS